MKPMFISPENFKLMRFSCTLNILTLVII